MADGVPARQDTATSDGPSRRDFFDVDTGDVFWLSGPHRDRRDTRYSTVLPEVDDDVQESYGRFLAGEPLPGREGG
jgi:hypothetical protein